MAEIVKLETKANLPTTREGILAARKRPEPKQVLDMIKLLNASYASQELDQETMVLKVKSYVMVLKEWPIEPIEAAINDFILGRVERDNRNFVPSAEALAKQVQLRFWQIEHDKRKGQNDG